MSAKYSSNNPLLLMVLLLFIPAHDGVERPQLKSTYTKDFQALLQSLQLKNIVEQMAKKANEQTGDDNDLNPDNHTEHNTDNDDLIVSEEGSEVDQNELRKATAAANQEFNVARSQCGLDTLSTDAELQKIALGHANYIKYVFSQSQPTSFNAHYQNEIADIAAVTSKNNPYYSGLDIKNRLFNADYANINYGFTENVAQNIYYHSAGELVSAETASISMAKSLLAAPYHLSSIMLPSSKVVGTAVVAYKPYNKDVRTNQSYALVSNAAATAKTASASYNGILTYPCQGVAGTATALYNETPDPVKHTGRNLITDPIGQPVFITVPAAKRIKITNISFYDAKRNTKIPTQILDNQSDPYLNTEYELSKNEAFILPITDSLKSCKGIIKKAKNCGLHDNSEYRVSFDVLVDNQAIERKIFTFTTGAVNY